ncbi:MAG: alpha/beta fold hydrolase [Clostridia bacterium]|nr:alpha/beta fold hydrolase [Clostridia bacterium]
MIFSKQIGNFYKRTLFNRQDPDGSVYYFLHKDFDGLSAEPFSFTTPASDLLKGNIYYYRDFVPGKLVVFDHGMGNGHRAYMREIETLCRHGYRVLSYDHTGCNSSEGQGIRGLSGSLYDLDACISAIKSTEAFSDLDIYVVGHSWGAFSAMNIPAYHPSVKAVVAMSGFSSVSEMLRQVFPKFLAPWRSSALQVEADMNPDHFGALATENLKDTSTRVLFIHSTDDSTASYTMHFEKLRQALSRNANVSFLTVEGKDHNPNYTIDAVKYKNEFFRDLTYRKKKKKLQSDEQKSAFVSSYDFYRMTEQDMELWQKIFDFLDKE